MMRSNVTSEVIERRVARRWLQGLGVLVALSLAAGVCLAPAQTSGGNSLEEQLGALYKELAEALAGLRLDLSYYDQIDRMAVAQGRLGAEEAETRLKAKGRELYSRAYTEDDLRSLLDQHREALKAYFQHIEQEVNTSTRWPGEASAEAYRDRARSGLELLRRDYEARVARSLDALPVLESAAEVLGWAMGHQMLPAALNPFAGQRDRVLAAIPSADLRQMLAAADPPGGEGKATDLPPAQTLSRPPPSDPSPPPTPPSGPPPGTGPLPPAVPQAQAIVEAKLAFQQGLSFAAIGRIEESIQEFSAAIRLDPYYAVAYANRGVAYMVQKKYNKALDDLTQAVTLNPQDRNAFYNLAVLYTLRKEFDRAIDALDQSLTLGFDHYDALRHDPDLAGLRKQSEFRKLLEHHKIFR